ncbi:MAG: type II secretion system F family protein [Acidobacteria bacterium]|nr:type II secretion system F family protein [Acidobacteriota bacterium]
MPTYAWKGRTRTGQTKEGVMVAPNKAQVIANLRRQQIMVTRVTERGKEVALPRLTGGVKQKELAVMTRQLSFMIDAGLPLNQCFEILASQQENKTFQRILYTVRDDIEAGSSLADALRSHPKVFNNLYCNMVAAGEAGGILDTILQRLSTYIEKAVKLKGAIRSAMMYPIAVIAISILVIIILLWKVIPTFAALFAGLGAELPLPTRITIALSTFLGNYILFIIGGLVALALAFRAYYHTYSGRRRVDGTLLKLPVIGQILRKIAIARFCRTLGTLVSSGVPILDAMEITAKTAGNAVIEDGVILARKNIEEGKTIADPLRETGLFPPMVTHMISVGEQTGELDAMVNKVADFYEDEVDTAISGMLSLMEPLIILFLGVTVGFIVVSMYMPMFTLLGKLQ